MPFKSEAQRRYMWKFHPEIAKRWAHEGHDKGMKLLTEVLHKNRKSPQKKSKKKRSNG